MQRRAARCAPIRPAGQDSACWLASFPATGPAAPAPPDDGGSGHPVARVSSAQVVSAAITVHAPIRRVFDHWTIPSLMDAWLGADASCDPREGGVFAFTSIRGAIVRGVYDAVFPPHLLVFRWDADDARGGTSPGVRRIPPSFASRGMAYGG